MKINTKLSFGDRIGSLVGGVGMIAYPFLREVDKVGVHVLMIVAGLALLAGGVGGT